MQQITCDACHQLIAGRDVINYGSIEQGYRRLCGRCFNKVTAERLGLKDCEHVEFEPICMVDARGRYHEFHFSTRLFGTGLALEAFERRNGARGGYRFQVIGEARDDPMELLTRLIARMRRALAITHIEDSNSGLQVGDRMILRGIIDPNPDAAAGVPTVVIDGREISWNELGRMMATFTGWQFKLEFHDQSEEI